MAGNGKQQHASGRIPPTISRIITKHLLEGGTCPFCQQLAMGPKCPNGHDQPQCMFWAIKGQLPINSDLQIAKMFQVEEPFPGVEVYSAGQVDGRVIGVRTFVRIEDVRCIDEVMDMTTWDEEIRATEDEEGDEPEQDEADEPELDEPEAPKPKEIAPPVAPATPAS
jgi:hypothetical protein